MECFKTPVRRKAYEFHSQVRSEQLSKMKTTIRAINDYTAKKESQNDQFNKLCEKLATNCNNSEALQQMKKMYKQQGFIIKQSNGRKVNLALKQFLRKSQLKNVQDRKKDANNNEIQLGCYIARQKKQSIVRKFYQLLVLLSRNAYRYPQYGCFDNPDILDTFIEILKTTSHERINTQILMLINLVSQNIATKKYFLSHNIISILANQRFKATYRYRLIENLLTDIFNIRSFKLTKEIVDQLMKLFSVHKELIFTQLDEDSINQMQFFIKCATQQLTDGVKNYTKFNEMMFFLLKKVSQINCNENKNYKLLYAKILDTIIPLISTKYTLSEDNENCLMQHLQKFWKINTQKVKQYQQLIVQIFQNGTNQSLENNLSLKKEYCQTIINSFMTFFQFTYELLPKRQKIKIYGQQLLYHFYEQFKKGTQHGKLTFGQFRFLIKNYPNYRQIDFRIMTEWFEYSLQDKQCRIQCLKKLSAAAINEYITLQEFGKLRLIYEEKRQSLGLKFDQLTYFILNRRPIPTNYDILKKQKEIKQKYQEKESKQMEENLTETNIQVEIDEGYSLRQLECIRKLG